MPQLEFFDADFLPITLRLLAALLVGGMIGLERSYHGRPRPDFVLIPWFVLG